MPLSIAPICIKAKPAIKKIKNDVGALMNIVSKMLILPMINKTALLSGIDFFTNWIKPIVKFNNEYK